MKTTFIRILLLLFLGSEVNAQIAANWQVGTWYQFKTAAVSYTFDDNCTNQLPVALPLFNQRGFKVTFFAVMNWSPNWTALQTASNNGHEVASHTVSHPTSLATLSLANQDTELKQSQATINTNITNAKCLTLAYPNCNAGDLATTQKYYIAARACQGNVESSTPANFYNISSIITGNTGSVTTAANLNAKVDAAKTSNGWCVFLTHGIDNDGGYSPTQSTEINAHLTYMSTNTAVFWVGTFGHVVKYIRERNAAALAETAITSDSLQITVTDNLDNTIYNVPITVRRLLPTGWTGARVYLNNLLTTSSISTISGKAYVTFNIVPDVGKAYLANTNSVIIPSAPVVTNPIVYCQGASASSLTASGTSLKWYTASVGGVGATIAPMPITTAIGITNYYVTQTPSGIESARARIVVTVTGLPSVPVVIGPITYCQNAVASILTASGSGLKWYTVSIGGIAMGSAPLPVTSIAGTSNYYVSQTNNGCEGARAQLSIIVNAKPVAPITSSVGYCQNVSDATLTAAGSNLLWYTTSLGGVALTTVPSPSTATVGSTVYYVSQSINGCESGRASLGVSIYSLPAVTINPSNPPAICQGQSIILTASGANTYNWKIGNSVIGTGAMLVITSSGSYFTEGTNANNCKNTSSLVTITVNSPTVWYADSDGDGAGNALVPVSACVPPMGYVSNSNDQCPNDGNKAVPGNCGCGKTELSCLDCNGVPNGTAVLDNCGTCVGGNTGKTACTKDCNNVFGGTAYLDNCGTCVGGNTGKTSCIRDCNNVYGGSAHFDNCGTCVGGNTGKTACTKDCNNVFGGTAYLDNCGTCVGGNTGKTSCIRDCNNVYGGNAHLDNCGTCVGGNTGKTACIKDCNNVFGGTAYLDNCGTCVGGNTGNLACVMDCNNEWGGVAFVDSCQICAGGTTGKTPILDKLGCTITVSSQISTQLSLRIYPNPSDGNFTIDVPSDGIIEIYTLDGKPIETFFTQNKKNFGGNYPLGIYLLKFKQAYLKVVKY